MILVFVEGPDALGVDNKGFESISVFVLDSYWFVPHPKTFGAWINSGSDSEALSFTVFVKKNAIQQKTLACSVLASDSDNANMIRNQFRRHQQISSLFGHIKSLNQS